MTFITNSMVLVFSIVCIWIVLRIMLYRTGLILVLNKWFQRIEDRVHLHQLFKVPQFNHQHINSQELNHFYVKVSAYLNSLPSFQDSDSTNLFARTTNSNDILLLLDDNQQVHDEFLGARLTWLNQVDDHKHRTFVLRIKKKDKWRILKPYIQHIHTVSDEILEHNTRRDQRNLFMNGNGRWSSVPWTHPSTMDTMVMDSDLKNKVKLDLDSFLKSKHYYHRMGRVWKRSYLLYGPSGTGKSSFVAAIAKFLCYDVYDLDLYKVADDSDLKTLLLQTTNKSVIVVEDLDRFLMEAEEKKPTKVVSLTRVMNIMDGLASSCYGEQRVFVFTANNKGAILDHGLRIRIDVHIHFPLCDFESFKSLANSYLGLKDHKLFTQVEGLFSTGGPNLLSAAEISEIMIANRSSPTRALKTVITASLNGSQRLSQSASSSRSTTSTVVIVEEKGRGGESAPVKELRKLYGLLRMKSTGKIEPSDQEESMTKIIPR